MTFFTKLSRLLGNHDTSFIYWRGFPRCLFPPYTGGSSDHVFGVSIYGNSHYEKRWFKLTFRAVHSLARRVDRVYYWFLYRLSRKHQYHIVRTDLRPGYYDIDEVMFRSCFALLCRFVERELGKAGDDENDYRGYRLHFSGDSNQKAIDLYLWYKHELPEIERLYDEDLLGCYGGDDVFKTEPDPNNPSFHVVRLTRKRERRFPHDWPETVKEEKLRELIEMRRSLWT